MSQENLEIVRAATAAWDRGDWDAVRKDAAPDVELDNTRELGEWRGVHTTAEQARRAFERFAEPWESVAIELDELIDAGPRVISCHTGTFRGRDGMALTAHNYLVWHFRDGLITRVVSYREFEEAREAAGLPNSRLR